MRIEIKDNFYPWNSHLTPTLLQRFLLKNTTNIDTTVLSFYLLPV